MRIILDIMGGDRAPDELLRGAFSAAERCDADFMLVGDREIIRRGLAQGRVDPSRFAIVGTDSVVTMEDDPLAAVRKKKDSSMMTALTLLAEGKGDGVVSTGNTGALFSGAHLIVKPAACVKRAAIGTLLPGTKPCLLLDAGANVTVTEEYLEQFAVIGTAYMRKVHGVADPEVGILNNGKESCKGTRLQIGANERLRANRDIHFIGNVEASAVLNGICDVVVCDGFTGNIFLKATEGMGNRLLYSLKEAYSEGLAGRLSYLLIRKKIQKLKRQFDPSEHGGSPILGISKPIVKAHGASDAFAFANAILQAVRYVDSHVTEELSKQAAFCKKDL